MPRDGEDSYGEGYGEFEKRSELVYDLPEPDADAPTGDGGDGNGDGGGSGDGGDSSGDDSAALTRDGDRRGGRMRAKERDKISSTACKGEAMGARRPWLFGGRRRDRPVGRGDQR